MFHLPCKSDRHAIQSLYEILSSVGLLGRAPELKEVGIKSAWGLEHADRSQLRRLLGPDAFEVLFCRTPARPSQSRKDIPRVMPYARGSLARAENFSQASAPVPQHPTLEEIDAAFMADRFAKSSREPRESRWNTWCRLAALRQLPPLPVTVDLLFRLGALFRHGRYRSTALYITVAKQKHVEAGFPWGHDLDRQQTLRSVERGQGPSRPKLPLKISAATADAMGELDSQAWKFGQARLLAPKETLIAATWFLLRGLEIASARCADLALFRAKREARLRLPVSKTDVTAKGCERTHACICNLVHEPTCPSQAPAELLFVADEGC